jgi:hypothetical protein
MREAGSLRRLVCRITHRIGVRRRNNHKRVAHRRRHRRNDGGPTIAEDVSALVLAWRRRRSSSFGRSSRAIGLEFGKQTLDERVRAAPDVLLDRDQALRPPGRPQLINSQANVVERDRRRTGHFVIS